LTAILAAERTWPCLCMKANDGGETAAGAVFFPRVSDVTE
jgi:hypothetical protein